VTPAPLALALVGTTATGKTALAEALAAHLDVEVICADSRQVFRELEIGTGKPTPEERARRPHHLFEALSLGQRASAGWYASASGLVRAEVRARRQVPLLCGGSGLWLRAAQEGLAAEPPHDAQLRARLDVELRAVGPEALHRRLASVDPITARRLEPRDRQRITRALEVWEASGKPLSWWHAQQRPPRREDWRIVELVVPPAELRGRIAKRTRWMFDHGLLEETRALLEGGRGDALRDLKAVGYQEAIAHLDGQLDRGAAERRVNLRTAQLAKRQRTWFRHQLRAVRLEVHEIDEGALLQRALEALALDASRRRAR
jgi:tRNA dimethylallyltransferase